MEKKSNKSIIIGITGLMIVTLILLGLTYAYYRTRIIGNSNEEPSISVSTKKLELVYGDGNKVITASNIEPGDTIGPKTFTVTNTGNVTVDNFSVVLEYAYVKDEDGNVITPSIFERPEDFEITLTCVTSNNETCLGTTTKFNNESLVLVTTSIPANETYNYSLKIDYANPNVDQSNDMGKNLNLKVQIYSALETTDIQGTITGVDETNSVRLQSDTKISPIINVGTEENPIYSYAFNGVEMGTHTLTILDEEGEEVKDSSGNAMKTYMVVKNGATSGISTTTTTTANGEVVDAIEITAAKSNRVVNLQTIVDTENNTVQFDAEASDIGIKNPYDGNSTSLAYNIINNSANITESQKNLNYAEYMETPLTNPARGIGNNVFTKYTDPTSFNNTTSNLTKYYIYSDKISLDKDGYFVFENPQIGTVAEDASKMVGKYVASILTYDNISGTMFTGETTASQYLNQKFLFAYKIGTETTTSKLYYGIVNKVSTQTESILTTTTDDYGTSYYFRGGVENNYVNFAGMCWRIVRIQGDGSIKIILEDKDSTCNGSNYTGNWAIPTNPESNLYAGNFGYTLNSIGSIQTSGGVKNPATRYTSDYLHGLENSERSMATAFKNFQNDFTNNEISLLKVSNWCYDDIAYSRSGSNSANYTFKLLSNVEAYDNKVGGTTFFYDSYRRLGGNSPLGFDATLSCRGTKFTSWGDTNETPMYVGALTADEAMFAGGRTYIVNANYYLVNKPFINDEMTYNDEGKKIQKFWTLSPHYFDGTADYMFVVRNDGGLGQFPVRTQEVAFRPVVVLKTNVNTTGGNGTQSNPYVIG